MRPLSQSDIFQIEITQRCFLRCGNCTHGVAVFEHPQEMSIETFEQALDSMEGYPGLIGLIGGEPTTHSRFEEICRIFKRKWGGETPVVGRAPIADFNAYVNERLFDRRARRGLWTSLGAGFARHHETIADTFAHLCVNDHRNPGLHQALWVTRKEMGIGDVEWEQLRDSCWVANTWSGSITVHGKGYFCEVAGMIDSVLHGGANGWPLEKGWWRRKPSSYGAQLDLCENCGLALKGPALEGRKDKTILTPLSLEKLTKVNAPLVRRGDFILYDPANPQAGQAEIDAANRAVVTKDSYMPCADMRVSPDNESVRPRKLSAVVVCVGRAEHLRQTLAWNARQVDELYVVTHGDDRETFEVFPSGGVAHTTLRWSDACFKDGAAFNKGAMLNYALSRLDNPDWILFTDADVFLPPNLRDYFHTHTFNPGVLYGASRMNVGTYDAARFAAGDLSMWHGIETSPNIIDNEANGFFQLWHPKAHAIRARWPAVMSEAFCSAGGIDSWFMQQWPLDKIVRIPELVCAHIDHSASIGDGWNGGRASRPHWRQCGMIGHNGVYGATEDVPPSCTRFKLTETLTGESVECELGPDGQFPPSIICSNGTGGLLFKGRDIGYYHAHVAYWFEPAAVPV